jgi:hypothetical protein
MSKSLLLIEIIAIFLTVKGQSGCPSDQDRESFLYGVFPPGLSWGYGTASYQVVRNKKLRQNTSLI